MNETSRAARSPWKSASHLGGAVDAPRGRAAMCERSRCRRAPSSAGARAAAEVGDWRKGRRKVAGALPFAPLDTAALPEVARHLARIGRRWIVVFSGECQGDQGGARSSASLRVLADRRARQARRPLDGGDPSFAVHLRLDPRPEPSQALIHERRQRLVLLLDLHVALFELALLLLESPVLVGQASVQGSDLGQRLITCGQCFIVLAPGTA